jgi:hypothetical protein
LHVVEGKAWSVVLHSFENGTPANSANVVRTYCRSSAGISSELVLLFVAGVVSLALSCMEFVKCSTASSMSIVVLCGICKFVVLSSA